VRDTAVAAGCDTLFGPSNWWLLMDENGPAGQESERAGCRDRAGGRGWLGCGL